MGESTTGKNKLESDIDNLLGKHKHSHHHRHRYWEDESEEVKARKLGYIKALLRAFKPISIYGKIFGRFPFTTIPKSDGTVKYVAENTSFNTIYFVFTTGLLTALTFCSLLGFILMLALEDGSPTDVCGKTWTEVALLNTLVPVAASIFWIVLTFYGSVYMFLYGVDYANYINYWKRAIKIMDMDVSGETLHNGIKQMVVASGIFLVFLGLFISFKVDVISEGAVVMAQVLVRAFKSEIYKDALIIIPNSNRTKLYCTKWMTYHSWAVFGFFFQMYGLMASQSFILQFRFFCGTLNQASQTWCHRFQNAMNKVETDELDETKRRLGFKELLKDHLVIVELFKLTDVTFGLVLLSYYFLIIIAFCFEIIYLFNGLTFDQCQTVVHQFDAILDYCPKGRVPTLFAYLQREYRLNLTSFGGCNENKDNRGGPDTLIALFFLVQTVYFFLMITLNAANASESAMRGFQILRRHNLYYCTRRKERNFIQSLVFSYVHNNPIQLSAWGYFYLGRPLVVNVILAVTTWFIIAIQVRDMLDVQIVIDNVCTNDPKKAYNYNKTI